MLKTVVLWLLLQPLAFIVPGTGDNGDCPPVLHFYKTGKTSGSVSVSWGSAGDTVLYRLWYVREADGYVGQTTFTSATTHTFTGLIPGRYTFYIATVCGEETSSFIGVEDVIEL